MENIWPCPKGRHRDQHLGQWGEDRSTRSTEPQGRIALNAAARDRGPTGQSLVSRGGVVVVHRVLGWLFGSGRHQKMISDPALASITSHQGIGNGLCLVKPLDAKVRLITTITHAFRDAGCARDCWLLTQNRNRLSSSLAGG